MIWSVDFAPLLPVWLVIIFAVLAAALVALGLWRGQRGMLVRACAFAALLLAILNPAIEREDREPLSSVVALVVDNSQSQDLTDRKSTTALVQEALKDRLELIDDVEVRIINAGRNRDGIQEDGTALFDALTQGLSDVPPERVAGAVMITDGQVHDIPENVAALGFDAPLHTLITGRPGERDRRVVLHRAPRFGLVDGEQQIQLRVMQAGSGINQTRARLLIRHDGELIGEQRVSVGETVSIPVQITHGGPNIYEIEAEALDDELTLINNRAVITIDGIRENLRVLLVSGEPHAGERTWRNLLKSDAAVDLVHFTILRPPEKQDGTPINQLSLIAFPTRELFSVKIDEFDLIIFDRYQRRNVLPILYFDNIARFVRDGGAVLIAAGPDYANGGSLYRTPLSTVLPAEPSGEIIETPYHAKISERGNRHPVTRALPGAASEPPAWSRWFRIVDTVATEGETVMEGPDDKPLLVLDRRAEGRVALLLSDHAWLWARGYEGGGPHVQLLRRLAHWLMKEPDLEEEALRLTVRGTQLTVERQTLGEEVEPVIITPPSGDEETLTLTEAEPGLWRATMRASDLGLYSVTDGEYTALAHVGPPNPREFTDVISSTETLAPLAEATRGSIRRLQPSATAAANAAPAIPRVVALRRASSFAGAGWIGLKLTDASVLKGIDRIPLFVGFLGLAILLGTLTMTWYREGR